MKDVRKTKIHVPTPEISEKVQKKLFELGYEWYAGTGVKSTNKEYLFIYNDKHISWEDSDSYFKKHPHKEITPADLGINIFVECNTEEEWVVVKNHVSPETDWTCSYVWDIDNKFVQVIGGCSTWALDSVERRKGEIISFDEYCKQHGLKAPVDSWCVEVTEENREVVKEWFVDLWEYSIGSYYGVNRDGSKWYISSYFFNDLSDDIKNTLLTTEQFYEEIGHKPENKCKYKVGDHVKCVKTDEGTTGAGYEEGLVFNVTEIGEGRLHDCDVLFGGRNGKGVYSAFVEKSNVIEYGAQLQRDMGSNISLVHQHSFLNHAPKNKKISYDVLNAIKNYTSSKPKKKTCSISDLDAILDKYITKEEIVAKKPITIDLNDIHDC